MGRKSNLAMEIGSAVTLQEYVSLPRLGGFITTNYFNPLSYLLLFFFLAECMRKMKDLHSQVWKFLVGCFNSTRKANMNTRLLCLRTGLLNTHWDIRWVHWGMRHELGQPILLEAEASVTYSAGGWKSCSGDVLERNQPSPPQKKSCHKPSQWETFLRIFFFLSNKRNPSTITGSWISVITTHLKHLVQHENKTLEKLLKESI